MDKNTNIQYLKGVGEKRAALFARLGIRTVGDLANTPLDRVQRIVGVKMGSQIHAFANGIDDSPVHSAPEEAKGYSISTTLEEDVVTAEQAHRVLLALTDSVTARMRSERAKACCVAVSIRSNDFKTRSHQRKLSDPTDISREVYQLCRQLFAELWDGHTPLRLLGVALTELTKEDSQQLSLFPDEKKERSRKLDRAYDAINQKFGAATIQRGSNLQSEWNVGKKYQAQMEQKKKDPP
jgi:DNA polymerase-4